jgi:ADP-ribose pyrophosphatase YjhB (NUDIX family)
MRPQRGNTLRGVAPSLPPAVALRRLGYRFAYASLRVYWFARRPPVSGVKCVLTDRDRVLLVRHTYGPAEWLLPGGAIKRRERPLSAVRREMREELGIDIEHWRALGEVTGRMHHRRDTLHCFQAELHDPVLTIDRGELAAAGWFSRRELPPDLGRYVHPILARAGTTGDD